MSDWIASKYADLLNDCAWSTEYHQSIVCWQAIIKSITHFTWNFMAIEQHDAQQIQLKQPHLPNLAICQDGYLIKFIDFSREIALIFQKSAGNQCIQPKISTFHSNWMSSSWLFFRFIWEWNCIYIFRPFWQKSMMKYCKQPEWKQTNIRLSAYW